MDVEKQAQQEKQADLQIRQQAGEHATQIGQVTGPLNIYNYYADSGKIEETEIDLAAYRKHLKSQFAIWKERYTLLDVQPMVSVVGQDLQPLLTIQIPVTQAVQEHERLIIIGDAGSGKTTSLHFIAQETTEDGSEDSDAPNNPSPVCVYIELGRFRMPPGMSPLQSLLVLVAETFYIGNASPQPPSLEAVYELLSNNQCLLLFDGLNEVQSELRSACAQAIDDLAQRYPDHRYVMTTRPHGFSPLQHWDVVALRELDDHQISEFLTRYTDQDTARHLLQYVLDAQNSLLRLPLFLTFVLRMRDLPLSELQTRMKSRSGIIDMYVKYLIERDTLEKHLALPDLRKDQIHTILSNLADQIQHTGQALPFQEAILSIFQHSSLTTQEIERIVNNLCERGILTTDSYYIRFWHHTIQEYFYAGTLVARWRNSGKPLKKPPRWLRRVIRESKEEDALIYMIAHLDNEELEQLLPVTSKENPGLVMLWADDLMAENRCVETVLQSFTIFRENLLAVAKRYWGPSTILFCIFRLLGGIDSEDLIYISFVGLLTVLTTLFYYREKGKWEAFWGTTLNIQNDKLRSRLVSLTLEISELRSARNDIKHLVLSINRVEMATDIVSLVKISSCRYISIRTLGYVRNPMILPLCEYLLKYNNIYSYAALQALTLRTNRFSEEKETVTKLAWNIWQKPRTNRKLRKLAGQYLHCNKESPGNYYPFLIWNHLSKVLLWVFIVGYLPVLWNFLLPEIHVITARAGLDLSLILLSYVTIVHVVVPILVGIDATISWDRCNKNRSRTLFWIHRF